MSRNLKVKNTLIFVNDEGVTETIVTEDDVAFDTYTDGSLFWDVENTDTLHISFPMGATAVAVMVHNTSDTAELVAADNCGDSYSAGPGYRSTKLIPTGPDDDTPAFKVEFYPFDTYEVPITLSYRVFSRAS